MRGGLFSADKTLPRSLQVNFMPSARFFAQPSEDSSLADVIADLLEEATDGEFNFAVAFAKNSGLGYLEDSLRVFKENGGKTHAFVGFDLDGTSYEALLRLSRVVDTLYVVHVASANFTFHPKVYNLKNEASSVVIVGSSNLTGGGLASNFEDSLILNLSLQDEDDRNLQHQLDDYFSWLVNYAPNGQNIAKMIVSEQDIDQLLEAGLLFHEADIRPTRRQKEQSNFAYLGAEMFPKGLDIAIPKQSSKNQGEEEGGGDRAQGSPERRAQGKEFQSLWIESNVTGGSGNQLNLSKRGYVLEGSADGSDFELPQNDYIKGTLCFFDSDNGAVEEDKYIAIEYEGELYEDNKIHFYHAGSGKNPNESWRLQLQGTDSDGDKMLTAYQGGNLKNKIILFERLTPADTYRMKIYGEAQLEEFAARSKVVASNNSRSGKKFGLF